MHCAGRTQNFLILKLVVHQNVKANADIRNVGSSTSVVGQGVNNFWAYKNSLLQNTVQSVGRW